MTSQTSGVGICGTWLDVGPGTPIHCTLLAGHAGWHGNGGTSWGKISKRERETVSTERRTEGSDFKDGDRVWVKDEDNAGTITFAGGRAALVLMDNGVTCRAPYTHLSRLIPQTHTDVPDDSVSASEGHTEPPSTIPQTSGTPFDVECAECLAVPGEECVSKTGRPCGPLHHLSRYEQQTSGSEQQTSGADHCYWDEYDELLKRSQTSWPGETFGSERQTSGVDMVNHPPHYQANPAGIEVIQVTEHLNFCLGNATKYILRCDHKGDAEKDLRKAIWYLERELQRRAAPASVAVSPNEEEQVK